MNSVTSMKFSALFFRLALGTAFLFSVADRFGLRGPHGQPNVYWGDFEHFTAYVARVNSFLSGTVIPAIAWITTVAETLFGVGLLLGVYTRLTAIGSGTLLFLFGTAMTISLGFQTTLAYSVFAASAGAFLLASCDCYFLSLDALLKARSAKLQK